MRGLDGDAGAGPARRDQGRGDAAASRRAPVTLLVGLLAAILALGLVGPLPAAGADPRPVAGHGPHRHTHHDHGSALAPASANSSARHLTFGRHTTPATDLPDAATRTAAIATGVATAATGAAVGTDTAGVSGRGPPTGSPA